ncbi:hypothetical protein F9802_13640 [Bacillus aerolatus]|uniref:MFS transporter n=1 Tax=Bacillus aerolatus TaxID=2653354 RepID=A0A6I1FIN5_9BACI|nr:hypothetical protein F9802_13640 [Bacillus aerolatus]
MTLKVLSFFLFFSFRTNESQMAFFIFTFLCPFPAWSCYNVVYAISQPYFGKLIDKYGVRYIVSFSILVLATDYKKANRKRLAFIFKFPHTDHV